MDPTVLDVERFGAALVTLVVDSSAIIALLLDEPEAAAIEFALAESQPVSRPSSGR